MIDLKDLRELLNYLSKNSKEIGQKYGNVATATVGAVQRQLLVLENQGGTKFFGEPALSINDLMRTDKNGRGIINILAADRLMENPRLYSTFLLWLLSELFEELPEVGDLDKPKLVFFFDEAHLLFDEAPKALLDKIEQVVRLIRSKGVGVYFVTQNPLDVPDKVLAQLGNRVQHALRAFTPRDQKAVKAAAETFRPNPKLKTEKVITELGKGEALVSFLEGNGTPSMVERALIAPPTARIGPVTPAERKAVIAKSPIKGKYDQVIDPESAYEILQRRVGQTPASSGAPTSRPGPWGQAPREDVPPPPQQQSQPRRSGSSVPRMPRTPLPPEVPEQAPSGGGWGDVIGDVLGGGSTPDRAADARAAACRPAKSSPSRSAARSPRRSAPRSAAPSCAACWAVSAARNKAGSADVGELGLRREHQREAAHHFAADDVVEARETRHQILLVALRRVGAAEQEFRRRRNVLAVDDAHHHHVRMALQIVEHRDDQLRIAGMQHVIQRDDARTDAARGAPVPDRGSATRGCDRRRCG